MNLKQAIHYFQEARKSERFSSEKGLGTWFATTLMLAINVDLIVINESFCFHGEAFHTVGLDGTFPGGCIRFEETAEERPKNSFDKTGNKPCWNWFKPLKYSQGLLVQG